MISPSSALRAPGRASSMSPRPGLYLLAAFTVAAGFWTAVGIAAAAVWRFAT